MGDSNYKMSAQPGYVLVERSPDFEVDLDGQREILADMSDFCEAADCRKVLIVGPKTTVKLSLLDIYELGEEIAKLHLQIAVAESHDASSDDEEFLETVVFNRGGPIQFFESENEARDWLRVS